MRIARLFLLPLVLEAFAPAPPARTWFATRGARALRAADSKVPELDECPAAGEVRVEDGVQTATSVLTFSVDGDATRQAFRAAATHIANTTTIDGWRKKDAAKIPPEVVLSTIGKKSTYTCALDVILENEVNRAIERSGVKAIGQPSLVGDKDVYVLDRFQPGEPLALKIIVDVYPTVVFKPDTKYTDLEVEVHEEPPDAEKTRKAIMNLQNRYVDLNDAPDGHAAALGDVVVVDMEGFGVGADGAPAEPLPSVAGGDDVEVHLEAGKFMPGMVEGLVGSTPGEKREFQVTFPPHVRESSLANKPAFFKAHVKAVKIRELPALDDAFASKIRPGLTWAELEKEVSTAVNQEAQDKTRENRDAELAKALRELASVEIPSTLLVAQAREKFAGVMADFRAQGVPDDQLRKLVSPEKFEEFLAKQKDTVRAAITDSMIVEQIAGLEDIKPDDGEVSEQYENLLAQMRQKGEDANGVDESATREKIFQTLQKELVMDWVAERSTVKLISADAASA